MNARFLALSILTLLPALAPAEPAAPAVNGHGDAASEKSAADAANAMKGFKHDEGIKVDCFATEQLIGNPVAFAPDGKGRWFIAESYRQEGRKENGKPVMAGVVDNRGHMNWLDDDIASKSTDERLAMMHKFYPDPKVFSENFEKCEERITRLEDTDGDGKADKQTILADGFRDALDGTGAGIIAQGNDVWWTCIPNLWHFADADNDGKAEVREKLLSGFGVKFAFRGHDMHGLRFGPDGKLYFSIGDRALNVKDKEGKQWEKTETGSILRCNPDGTDFEIFATGVRNPQELAFDELGNLFTGDNNSDSGDKARFVNLVEGGDCGWRMPFQYLQDRGPWNRELLWDEKEAPKVRYLIPPIANIGNGPSGLTYNPGTALSSKYAGQFYMSDFRGGPSNSLVHQIALEPSGAWFKVKERRDFVKGVLTTDVEFGPDGSLYVLDWVADWSGVDQGRIFKFTDPAADAAKQAEVKKLLAEGFDQRPEVELEPLLAHADMRVRQGAQFALAGKGAVTQLTSAAQKGATTLTRVHGVWGLGQLGKKQPEVLTVVAALLADPDGEVRTQAARVLGDNKFAGANDALIALLKDAAPKARFYAALALGKAAHKPAADALFALLAENNDADPILRHGAIMGLTGCADAAQLVTKTTDPSPAVRGGAVVALRRQKSPQIAAFLKDEDQTVVLEAARAIYDGYIPDALPALAAVLEDKRITDRNILLRVVSAHYRLGKPENATALATYAADPSANEAGRKDALLALSTWTEPNPKDRLTYLWRPLPARPFEHPVGALAPVFASIFQNAPDSVQEAAASAAAKLALPNCGETLLAVVSNDKAGKTVRLEALKALFTLKDSRLGPAAKAAFADSDTRLRSEGLKALVAVDPASALEPIAQVLKSDVPAREKQGAVLALAESNGEQAEKLLGGLMDDLIAGKLTPEVQLDVYESSKKHPSLAEKVKAWKASLPKGDDLANFRLSLAGGDAVRGKKVFRDKLEVQCFRCHKCEGGDSVVGPELTKIGGEKDRPYILESIIFPNKQIALGFQIVVLELNDGNTVAGRLLSEANGQLQIETVDEKGISHTVPVAASNVKKRISAPSPMPETIRDSLNRSELRDVVEYLATRK